MFGTMLFLHLTSLVLWMGSLVSILILIKLAKRQIGSQEIKTFSGRAIRTFSWLAHSNSVIVLMSGIFMIIEMNPGSKPFWLNYMEKGGGMIILAAILLTIIFSRKAVKNLSNQSDAKPAAAVVSPMSTIVLFALIAAILSVVLVVSLRLM